MKQIKHPEFKLCYVSHSPVISRGTLTSPWTLSMSGWMETPQLYPSLKASIIRSSRVFATFFFVTWRIPRFGKLWEINWASHTIVLQASLRVCVWERSRPDGGVFGLQVSNADSFIALFSHQTVSVQVRDGGQRRHQLDHHPGLTLVVTDLKHTHR